MRFRRLKRRRATRIRLFIYYSPGLIIFLVGIVFHLSARSHSVTTDPATAFSKLLLSQPSQLPYRTQVVFIETTFNGLGAQYLRLISALSFSDFLNTTLCRPTARYWNYGCGPFKGPECYFEPLSCTNTCTNSIELSEVSPYNLPSCIQITTSERYTTAFLQQRFPERPLLECRKLAKRLWILNNQTKLYIKTWLDDILPSTDYIAIHIRRGDKVSETKPIHLSVYVRAISILTQDNETDVFIATDDGAVIPSLKELMPQRRILSLPQTESRRGHSQKLANEAYLKQNYDKVAQLLTEIEALRRAKWFIGTFSSNLARLVHVLRDQPADTSISLDDSWTSGPAWTTFGKPYCNSEDANKQFCNEMRW